MAGDPIEDPRRHLSGLVRAGDADALGAYLDALPAAEVIRAVSRLDDEDRGQLLALLTTRRAADLVEGLPAVQAAALLETVPADRAADILAAVYSDERADILAEVADDRREAILTGMAPAKADEVRRMIRYPADTAGGMMVTEYLSFPDAARVADVLDDLRGHADAYSRYNVQYAYVTAGAGELAGVLRLRDLLLTPADTSARSIMRPDPQRVRADATLDDLLGFFDRHPFFGAPVTDGAGRLLGVVRRADVEEAAGDRAGRTILRLGGVIGGEEFRTMPLATRLLRRLPWLAGTGVLNVFSAAIIGLYEDTLSAAIALAAFLPVISGLSGNAGNQAIAVSLRELALGLVKSGDARWVVGREILLGVVNAIVLGLALSGAAVAWKGNPYLGLVVGGALALSTLIAVCLGGALPLGLKRIGIDAALASGPILTTITDVCGFLLTLSFATALLHHLGP